jgi:hypothetical protein
MNAVTTFPGWHARLVLLAPGRVAEGLARLRAIGWGPVPNLWQVELAVLRMWERILFRSDTIGTCADDPPRRTLRARFLRFRPIRFFGLAWERAITPWDLSGFLSDEAQIVRHLLGAHHDRTQCVYDLQLLALHPGGLGRLRERVAAVVSGADPRAEWLRDLVVHEHYHERLLAAVERVLAGAEELDPNDAADPDISFRAWLRWCAAQPPTPAETWRAWREGRFTLRRGLAPSFETANLRSEPASNGELS